MQEVVGPFSRNIASTFLERLIAPDLLASSSVLLCASDRSCGQLPRALIKLGTWESAQTGTSEEPGAAPLVFDDIQADERSGSRVYLGVDRLAEHAFVGNVLPGKTQAGHRYIPSYPRPINAWILRK